MGESIGNALPPASMPPRAVADPQASAGSAAPASAPAAAGEPAWSLEWAQRFRDVGVPEDQIIQMHLTGGMAMDEAQLQEALDDATATANAFVKDGLGDNPHTEKIRSMLDLPAQQELARQALLHPEKSHDDILYDARQQRMMKNSSLWRMLPGMAVYQAVPGYDFAAWAAGTDPILGDEIERDPRKAKSLERVQHFTAANGAVQMAMLGRNTLGTHLPASRLFEQALRAEAAGQTLTPEMSAVLKVGRTRGLDQLTGVRRLLKYVPHTEANKAVGGLQRVADLAHDLASGSLTGVRADEARNLLKLAEEGGIKFNSHSFYMPGSVSQASHHSGGGIFGRGGARSSIGIGKGGILELDIGASVPRRLSSAYALAGAQGLQDIPEGTHLLDHFPFNDAQSVKRARSAPGLDGLAKRQMRVLGDVVEQMGMADDIASGSKGRLERFLHVARPTAVSEAAEAVRSLRLERAGLAAPGTSYRMGGLFNAGHALKLSVVGKVTARTQGRIPGWAGAVGKLVLQSAAVAGAVAGGMMLWRKLSESQPDPVETAVDDLYREYLLASEGEEALAEYAAAREDGAPLEIPAAAREALAPQLEAMGVDVNVFAPASEQAAQPAAANA